MLLQTISTIIFLLWLFLVAYLLYRHALGAGARSRELVLLLAESNAKLAQAAHESAEAAQKLAEILEKKHA